MNLLAKVTVKYVGPFRWATGKNEDVLEVSTPAEVSHLLETIFVPFESLKSAIDKGTASDLKQIMIVLVNGIEIGLLSGLRTPLSEGDTVTLIPTAHGG